MSAVSPPPAIVQEIAQRAPGFWRAFVERANRALSRDDVVTSWYRNPAHNAQVGGARCSQHLVGAAFDAVSPNLGALAARLRAQGFRVVTYETHVHAQAWAKGALERAGWPC